MLFYQHSKEIFFQLCTLAAADPLFSIVKLLLGLVDKPIHF